jgi:microcystin-dependent protein
MTVLAPKKIVQLASTTTGQNSLYLPGGVQNNNIQQTTDIDTLQQYSPDGVFAQWVSSLVSIPTPGITITQNQINTATVYNSTTDYAIDILVKDSGSTAYKIYKSLVDLNLNNPLTDSSKWQLVFEIKSVKMPIGNELATLFAIHSYGIVQQQQNGNVFLSTVEYSLGAVVRKINTTIFFASVIDNNLGADLSATVYNHLTTYAINVYVSDVNGDIYKSLVDLNLNNPLTDSSKWQKVWLYIANYNAFNTAYNFIKPGSNGRISEAQMGRVISETILLATNTPPSGFLLCNGQAVSRTTYGLLFAAIGTSFGGGDGSTTFNIPDLRGRVPGGIGQGPGLTNRNLGNYVGAETHTLTTGQLPTMTEHSGDYRFGMVRRNGLNTVVNTDSSPPDAELNLLTGDNFPGNNEAHPNMQPTVFAGNYYIYAGV